MSHVLLKGQWDAAVARLDIRCIDTHSSTCKYSCVRIYSHTHMLQTCLFLTATFTCHIHHCRIESESHIELPCNEVHGEEKDRVASKLSGAAREWWKSVVAGGHSFEKPTFQLGLNGWSVTNILPDGAHERTSGRIELLPNGAAGFSQVGDSMCFKLDVSDPAPALPVHGRSSW